MLTQVKEETSSANHGSSSLGTPAPSHLEGNTQTDAAHQLASGAGGSTLYGREDQHEEEANRKDSSAADDLRELAAKGVCAPLWRTNQPVQPVRILNSCSRLLAVLKDRQRGGVLQSELFMHILNTAAAASTLVAALEFDRAQAVRGNSQSLTKELHLLLRCQSCPCTRRQSVTT